MLALSRTRVCSVRLGSGVFSTVRLFCAATRGSLSSQTTSANDLTGKKTKLGQGGNHGDSSPNPGEPEGDTDVTSTLAWTERVRNLISRSITPATQLTENFDDMPDGYHLTPANRKHLSDSAFVHLNPSGKIVAQHVKNMQSFANRIIFTGPHGCQLFHSYLARATARENNATFIEFDIAQLKRFLPTSLKFIADHATLHDWADDLDREPSKGAKRILQQLMQEIVTSINELVDGPIVLFIHNCERLVFANEFRSAQFLEAFGQLTHPSVLIGSNVEIDIDVRVRVHGISGRHNKYSKMMFADLESEFDDEESDDDDAARLQFRISELFQRLQTVFPNSISTFPPEESEEALKRWDERMQKDMGIWRSMVNHRQLQLIMEENNIACTGEWTNLPVLSQRLFSDAEIERMLGSAVTDTARSLRTKPDQTVESTETVTNAERKLVVSTAAVESAWMRHTAPRVLQQPVKPQIRVDDEFEEALLPSLIQKGQLNVKFDDIGSLEAVKQDLFEIVILPLKRPDLFKRGNLIQPCKGVLLFGPPGTGKTMLAKAVASEASANFLNITLSNITSRWFGDAEKYVTALFSLAHRLAPCVIFIDEVDSLLSKRDGDHETMIKVKNQFMSLWDGLMTSNSDRVLVMCATNRPFELDDAVLRRLPRRLFVDLPDQQQREKILSVILANETLAEDVKLDEIAKVTNGYSGSDLKNMCIDAAYEPVRELLANEKANQITCDPADLRPVCLKDFLSAQKSISASLSSDATLLTSLKEWNRKYGRGVDRKHPSGVRYGF